MTLSGVAVVFGGLHLVPALVLMWGVYKSQRTPLERQKHLFDRSILLANIWFAAAFVGALK